MLKYVVFRVTGYYYEILLEKYDAIRQKTAPFQIELKINHIEEAAPEGEAWENGQETLFISDHPRTVSLLKDKGLYVIALYHERNRQEEFPGVRYAVEDVEQLEYSSYEEAYRRLAGLPWDILATERLLVRESIVEDVEEFYRIYEEPSITYYMEKLLEEHEKEKAYMESYIKQVYGFYGYGMWTVLLKENGQVIGRAGLSVREGYELPELGFVIEAAYQRRGFGYEVCKAILQDAGEVLYFDKVQALVKEANKASLRLLEKLGFTYECETEQKGEKYLLFVKKV